MFRILILLIIFSNKGFAQNGFFTLFGGISHYNGDLGNEGIPKIAYPAYGIGVTFELNPRMYVNLNFVNGKIGGDDKNNGNNKDRNLRFTSHLTEFSLQFEYKLFDLYEYKITPHLFTGLAIFNFSPYAKAQGGGILFLHELSTEGQGIIKERKAYKLTQLSVPLGVGATWALGENKRISLFTGIRKTFTDYIDDVSKTYVDFDLLLSKKGTDAVAMAFRTDELSPGTAYPANGTERGNPKNKDWYYFSGITYQVRILPPKKRQDKTRFKKGNTRCPVLY